MENYNKSRFWRSKAAITALVLTFVLVTGAVGLYAFNAWFGTALTINDSVENWRDEFVQRIETTPLVAVDRLMRAANEGVIIADIGVRQDGVFGINGDAQVRFFSNVEDTNFALMLDATVMGMDFDARVFVDRDSLAIGSDAFLGEGNFGLFYDSFRTDAQNFFNLMGLSQRDLEDVAEFVDIIAEQLQNVFALEDTEHNIQPYLSMLNDFINSIEQERLNTVVNGISVERISLEIGNYDLVRLLNYVYDLVQDDSHIRLMFDAIDAQDPWMHPEDSSFEWMLEDLRFAIIDLEDLEEEFLVTINFYVGSGNRLTRLYLGIDLEYEYIAIIMDMGAHALDTWTLELVSIYETILIEWTLDNHAGIYENRLTASSSAAYGTILWLSTWEPTGGDFTLGFESDWDNGSISFDGNLLVTDSAMTMQFDDIVVGDVTISLVIGAEVGVAVPQATFTNISHWDQDLIDHVEQQIAAFLFMASLLGW